MIRFIFAVVAALWVCATAHAADPSACAEHLPFGQPTLNSPGQFTFVCHKGYAALHDDDLLIPRWTAYRMTGPHTLGCNARGNNFHADENLPADRRATPRDYARSGYDKGHQAPAADFSWSKALVSDSFSMVNMAPQVPGLNRKQWERLEETARAWAWKRGELEIYVGPVMPDRPKTIGANHVGIPKAFWKVLVDLKGNTALAFQMPQRDIAKGALAPWQVSIADVERSAQITLPLPDTIDREAEPKLWPADVKAWNAARKAKCRK